MYVSVQDYFLVCSLTNKKTVSFWQNGKMIPSLLFLLHLFYIARFNSDTCTPYGLGSLEFHICSQWSYVVRVLLVKHACNWLCEDAHLGAHVWYNRTHVHFCWCMLPKGGSCCVHTAHWGLYMFNSLCAGITWLNCDVYVQLAVIFWICAHQGSAGVSDSRVKCTIIIEYVQVRHWTFETLVLQGRSSQNIVVSYHYF